MISGQKEGCLLDMARDYLQQQVFGPSFINSSPSEELSIVVVIPCYKEVGLIHSLEALKQCERPKGQVEVIVVINQSEKADDEITRLNEKAFEDALKWADENTTEWMKFFIHFERALPKKHAGVGLARKIGMDEALRRFKSIQKEEGVILCFDADSLCKENYLLEVEKHFLIHPNSPGCSIYYEHPTKGEEYEPWVLDAITQYELHLRYYRQALWCAGHPFAYHTIGSSMAVRAHAYEKQGGMNRRKAGEDFYFLQKIISLGNFTELNTTAVIPSPRPSDRVPFGTGKAVNDRREDDKVIMETYHPNIFIALKPLFENPSRFKDLKKVDALDEMVIAFLESIDYKSAIREIEANTKDDIAFEKRFYAWFNAFISLKYVHFARDNFYPNIPLDRAANQLLQWMGKEEGNSLSELLQLYRFIDNPNRN